MTLLALINEAAIELSLPVTASVMASSDPQIKLLRRCATTEAKSLLGRHNWQALLSEGHFVTAPFETGSLISTPAQPIATDFDRIVPESMFNRTTNRRVGGPIDSDVWQSIQSSLVTFVNPSFRIRVNSFYFTPTPPADQEIAYEYITKNWCLSAGSTPQSDWIVDTDTYRLNDESMVQGIVWRFKKSKGLAWNDDYLVYERYVGDLIIRDGSRPRIYTDQSNWDRRPAPPQVPDTLVFS